MRVAREDRRVARTEQLLSQALIQLIREKGYEDLTVQDIIDRANVGRSTFYAHFVDKEDLLVRGLDGLKDALKNAQRQPASASRADENTLKFSHDLFAHVDGHRDVFRAMVGKHSGAVIQKHFQRMLKDLIREELKAMGTNGTMPAEAVVEYVAGGTVGLMSWWMDARPHPSLPEVDAMFRKLVLPAIRGATR